MDISGGREQSPAIAMTPSCSIARTPESSIPLMWLTSGAGAEQKQYTWHFAFSASFLDVGCIQHKPGCLSQAPVLPDNHGCSEFRPDQSLPPRNDHSR